MTPTRMSSIVFQRHEMRTFEAIKQSGIDTPRQPIDKPLAVFLKAFSGLPGDNDPIIFSRYAGVLTRDTPQRYKLRHFYAGPTKNNRT